jgi:hypothetical protein
VSVAVVTGYVRLPCEHRSADDYAALGSQLLDLCGNAIAFRQPLAECWMAKRMADAGMAVEPGGKDTAAYHCVQHEKSRWIARAAAVMDAETLVWIDYGLLHNRRIHPVHVTQLLEAVADTPPTRIVSPSFSVQSPPPDRINWTFLGSVLVVPRDVALWFHHAVADAATAPPAWEVNTWAAVYQSFPDRFFLYGANHDETMFTRYSSW